MEREKGPVDGILGSAILKPSADHHEAVATGWFQIEIETAGPGHIAGKEGRTGGANGRSAFVQIHIEKSIMSSNGAIIAMFIHLFQCYYVRSNISPVGIIIHARREARILGFS
jgi:hypothetical protein